MGVKVTSKMKGQLQSQVHDKSMRKYLIQRKIWTDRQFKGIYWTLYLDETENRTAFGNATPQWRHSLFDNLELANEPTTQLFGQGIVATFLFVQVRTIGSTKAQFK
jgi:hypothetical protein